jgi:hypothetical protein
VNPGPKRKLCRSCGVWKNSVAFYRETDDECGLCSVNTPSENAVRRILRQFESYSGGPIRRVLFVRPKSK